MAPLVEHKGPRQTDHKYMVLGRDETHWTLTRPDTETQGRRRRQTNTQTDEGEGQSRPD